MSVSRNTLYNVAGAAVPVGLGLVAVPLYLSRVGESRYGVLAVVWLLLGYFGLFDLGLSRATANKIARLHDAPATEREEVFWTACLLNAALGSLGGLTLWLIGGPLLGQWFKMAPGLHQEALAALPWIAAAVPVATISAVLSGALEGRQRFAVVNIIQAAGTISFQAIPLAAAYLISPTLQVVVPVAVIVRIVSVLPLSLAVRAALPARGRPLVRVERIRQLLTYGIWVTVTNLVGPLLDALDRVLIGVVLGAPEVAYYAVPFGLMTRTQVLARALARTLFPYLSADTIQQARTRVLDSLITLGAVMLPMAVLGMFLLHPFLTLWMGARFAARAAPVGEALLCGMWLNGLASVPFAMLQAQGRPDIVAKFHLLELAPFLACLWYGLHRFGLVGAAAAWALRVAIDAILLIRAAGIGREAAKCLIPGVALVLCAWLSVRALIEPFDYAKIFVSVALTIASGAWSIYTSARVRQSMMSMLPRFNA
jgi:O-antigen/teichoic acid export membrane protein